MLASQRQQIAEFLRNAGAYLEGLGDRPVIESDYQADDFYRIWRKLPARPEGQLPYVNIFPGQPNPQDDWIVMRPTSRRDNRGLIEFELTFRRGQTLIANSGAPSRQELIDPRSDKSGSNRPIPEGVYRIGPVERAKYGSWGEGLGAIWLDLIVLPEFRANNRSALGFHLDANRANSPGSAGCVVFADTQRLNRLLDWVKDGAKYLVVDHGLGFLRRAGYPGVLARNVVVPTVSRRVSARGIEFIKSWEDLKLEPYLDQAGLPTIGWGHLIQPGESFTRITEAEADRLFAKDLAWVEQQVSVLVKAPLTTPQFDAVASLTFNIGVGSLASSTIRQRLNQYDYMGASREFARWNKVAGKEPGTLVVSDGLVRRRTAETLIFTQGEYRNNA